MKKSIGTGLVTAAALAFAAALSTAGAETAQAQTGGGVVGSICSAGTPNVCMTTTERICTSGGYVWSAGAFYAGWVYECRTWGTRVSTYYWSTNNIDPNDPGDGGGSGGGGGGLGTRPPIEEIE